MRERHEGRADRRGGRRMGAGILSLLATLVGGGLPAGAQVPASHAPTGEFRPPTPAQRFRQDPSRNNLVHPGGYRPAEPNTLGRVARHGDGPTPLVLVAGLGFGDDIFDSLIDALALEEGYTVYAVSLAGYGGTSAPPMPPAGTSYGERTWLAGAQRGLATFIEEEGLERPLVGALYSDAADVVARVAARRPNLVGGVLLMSASARRVLPEGGPSRAERMDAFAEQWFKTVTEVMWPSGMFTPDFYAGDPGVAELAWWQVLEPSLPTSIRYTLETWASDLVPVMLDVQAPTVVLSPAFDFLQGDRRTQTRARFHSGWDDAVEEGAELDHRVVPGARFLIWEDAPEAVRDALRELADRRRDGQDSAVSDRAAPPFPTGAPISRWTSPARGERHPRPARSTSQAARPTPP
jgi:pimeloyl-ACP methyl ester carboxylesterase